MINFKVIKGIILHDLKAYVESYKITCEWAKKYPGIPADDFAALQEAAWADIEAELNPFLEATLEEWQLVLDVNLTGAFLCSKHAARHMRAAGHGGRIVNIASQAAKSGFPHLAGYVASKHGLVGFTRSIAIELGGDGITVNAVCPNHVTTGLGAKQNDYYAKVRGQTLEQFMAAMRARIPLGRPGLPEDTAAAVAFLASDDARYITGEAMNVSGGEEQH